MSRTRTGDPARKLLWALLDGYERSVSFGRVGPWKQDVIVRVDAKAFAEVFEPDGREAREALELAVTELARAGALRAVFPRGSVNGIPRDVRLGAAEVETAYAAAQQYGYRRLQVVLDRIAAHATRLADDDAIPAWMKGFLERLAQSAAAADLSLLGIGQRSRLKDEIREIEDALVAAAVLSRGVDGWERYVSARLFDDSKRLAEVRGRIVNLLRTADPRWGGVAVDNPATFLEAYGIRRRPATLLCAGAGVFYVNGHEYHLDDFDPAATLPRAWLPAVADGVGRSGLRVVTTVENEFPFHEYVRQREGPAGLRSEGELVVYVGGFPPPYVLDFLAGLVAAEPAATFRHWGDADVGGVSIWWLIRERLNRPVHLFRTTAVWIDSATEQTSRLLTPADRAALVRLRARLTGETNAPDLIEARALIEILLARGIKPEQESFETPE